MGCLLEEKFSLSYLQQNDLTAGREGQLRWNDTFLLVCKQMKWGKEGAAKSQLFSVSVRTFYTQLVKTTEAFSTCPFVFTRVVFSLKNMKHILKYQQWVANNSCQMEWLKSIRLSRLNTAVLKLLPFPWAFNKELYPPGIYFWKCLMGILEEGYFLLNAAAWSQDYLESSCIIFH